MKIYIPIRENVNESILQAIRKQSLFCNIENVLCNYDISIDKKIRIAKAKEECKLRALNSDDEFAIFHDSDMLNLCDDNFETLLRFMLNNNDYGAVSLYRRSDLHVCNSVMMVRRSILHQIDFTLLSPPRPTCISVMASAKNNGFKYGYVDKVFRVRHV